MSFLDEKPSREIAEAPLRRKRLVWDLPVRIFHWSLVASCLGAFVTHRLGVAWFDWHARFGQAALALVAFRIVWGAVGPKHARFASFVTSPRATLRYARALARGAAPRHAGHNPLGALMTLALLGGLGVQAALGLFADDEIFDAGPLASLVPKETSLLLTSWHRRGFYLLAGAIAIHIAAVLAHLVLRRENLTRAMITGYKPADEVDPADEIAGSRLPLAAVIATLALGAVVLLIRLGGGLGGAADSF